MPTLLLKLTGPMQSWGSRSRFDRRDTEAFPTKSGVLGLVAAALGRDRGEPVEDLAALRLGVRIDREGVVRYDFQTARDVIRAEVSREQWERARSKGKTTGTQDTVVSKRYYLADAAFLVGLEGEAALLQQIEAALRRPRWTLFLGRKGYLPGEPVHFPESAILDLSLEEALVRRDPIAPPRNPKETNFQYVIELMPDCEPGFPWLVHEIWDQPVAPFSERRFAARRVGVIKLPRGEVPEPCT